MRTILAVLLFLFSFPLNAEVIKISCSLADKSIAGSDIYLIDLKRKKVKLNCKTCDWAQTHYWGEDYISFVNSPDNIAFAENNFYQARLKVLNRQSLVMMSSSITTSDFSNFEFLNSKPNISVLKCVRGF